MTKPTPKPVSKPSLKPLTNQPTEPVKKHRLRTLFSSIFGIIALNLILVSVLVVWLNRTLTDTTTYVHTVAPLVAEPDIQNFLAAQATDNLLKNAPPADVASALLSPTELAATKPEQQAAEVKAIVRSSVLQILTSPKFDALWASTNQSAHADLLRQINSGAKTLSLDLSPLVAGVVSELKQTKLAPVSDKIDLPQDAGKLQLQGEGIAKFQDYYKKFKAGTWVLVAVALASAGLCVWLSVQHARTARRILLGTGVSSLFLALSLSAPSFVKLSGLEPLQQKAAVAFAGILFHDLQLACLILGIGCIVVAVGWKIASKVRRS